ncbi:hypothetical protein LTR99_001970 [Exophiala xenobiotica]|uniref:endo-1,3(4)-beta-glucanase n=1 Tax=Vermiconidia calcicola TaxID=1690605 RepID=A0AAV9Q995_9PEZI|nr:hypothetical protein H2202_007393 [Exophiala xenobiotica]KAK5536738.1 hypothetical protein LTR25_005412 [Vermiconidia calcicola]KAK5540365.1 hypothetical protein LTR23_006250 [Chaetothyriales sp. CCFEE 6169]KAK5211928.1 hypothetical protein LTR41_002170 [Exophiala xenobiotica]KAK5226251.1 hypothetical protein LTR72_004156 [Exophiala xenobiotica]
MLHTLLLALAGLVSLSTAGYVLEDDYTEDQFFSMFDFFTDADPTNGYVTYVDQTTAQSSGLISTNNGSIYMGVDHTNVATGLGRNSVRLTSTKTYTHGLIILDLDHMPGGVCGTWPAFWTVGANWPNAGEIDIIEGVNSQVGNSMALHTASGCSITNNGLFSGSISTSNCFVNAPGQAMNAGCQILASNDGASYGTQFNQGQGGVYATEWTSSDISIWFFPRSGIPSDISSGTPDPSTWGSPMGSFEGGCQIDEFFSNHQIVFDTTFCGDWAGNVWSTDATCGSKASTCQDFVQNNPSEFQDAYWSVNSLKVYQSLGGETGNNATSSALPFGPTASVSAGVPWNSGVSGVSQQSWSTPTVSDVPTAGFSRGGNGRFTKTFGNGAADFALAAAASTFAATGATATAIASSSPSAMVAAAVESDGAVVEAAAATTVVADFSQPEITAAAAVATEAFVADDSNGNVNVEYVTVTALGYDDFDSSTGGEKKRGVSVSEEGDMSRVKRHMQAHRHMHRHLFKHGVGSVEE